MSDSYFPGHGYWSGLPFPSPGDLPNPGVEPASPALMLVESLSLSHLGSPLQPMRLPKPIPHLRSSESIRLSSGLPGHIPSPPKEEASWHSSPPLRLYPHHIFAQCYVSINNPNPLNPISHLPGLCVVKILTLMINIGCGSVLCPGPRLCPRSVIKKPATWAHGKPGCPLRPQRGHGRPADPKQAINAGLEPPANTEQNK